LKYHYNTAPFLLGMLFLIFTACNNTSKPEKKELPVPKVILIDTIAMEPPVFKTTYSIDSIAGQKDLDSLGNRFDTEERKLIYALNRIDAHRIMPGTKLLIPDSLVKNLNLYTPFPKLLGVFDSINKAVVISKRIQAFALYEKGKLCKWGPVSTGKKTTGTPHGLYYGNYKAKRKVSTIDQSWVLPYYFNFMNFEGIGTHEYSLPGHPASHGCVRMTREDAQSIYNWANMWELENDVVVQHGTPFMVIGTYDFDGVEPWLKLAENKDANNLKEEELDTLRVYAQRFHNDPLNFKRNNLLEEKIVL